MPAALLRKARALSKTKAPCVLVKAKPLAGAGANLPDAPDAVLASRARPCGLAFCGPSQVPSSPASA